LQFLGDIDNAKLKEEGDKAFEEGTKIVEDAIKKELGK